MAKEKIEKNTDSEQAYWSYVKRQFRKNKRALFSAYFVAFLAFIALFADFLANEKPIVAKYQGVTYFPIAKSYSVNLGLSKWQTPLKNINWLDAKYDWAIRPLIPYSPTTVDNFNMQFVGPFDKQSIKSIRWKHWFGTEKIGRDILSGLIHGTRTAFLVGLVSMSIASLIGIILGSLAGFFGDNRLKVSRASAIGMVLSAIFGFFYAFSSRSQTISDSMGVSPIKGLFQLLISIGIFIAVCGIFYLLTRPMKFIPLLNKKTSVPIDIIVQRLIEILLSIPRLFLIIAIVAIAKPSIFLVMIVIGATSWTEIARFIRAELLKVRSLEYIEASEALGYSNYRILTKHAIPNALSPVLITIAFGIASAILVEAFLSFIGLGLPPEMQTWGKILNEARGAVSAWWMVIFPGFAIFITVTLFNLIGEGLSDALDPRQKR